MKFQVDFQKRRAETDTSFSRSAAAQCIKIEEIQKALTSTQNGEDQCPKKPKAH
jgi:hypothetical protein